MSTDYDYNDTKKMIEKIPNLNKTFNMLTPYHTSRFLLANKFSYFFIFGCVVLTLSNSININLLGSNSDFVYQFRIRPEFLTEERNVTYRKQAKKFKIY